MKKLTDVKKYSKKYDNIMNLELEVVENAYNTEHDRETNEAVGFKEDYLLSPKYSIKLPNDITGMEEHRNWDGDFVRYINYGWEDSLISNGLKSDSSLADYPRHGNTLRIFYKDLDKANAALYFLKKYAEEVA